MREYIYLFRGGKTSDATEEQLIGHEKAWDAWMDRLEDKGVLIDGLPLKEHAVLIDANGAGAKELTDDDLNGYLILETDDMESAVALASDCPIFEFGGTIEVRELESHLDDLHDDDDDDGFRDLDA